MSKNFFQKYFKDQSNLLNFDEETLIKLNKVKNFLTVVKKRKKKVIIFGNGGSAAIANHFSIDLTKTSKIRCVNFNESSLLTCFSNDYGYENWVKRTIEFHADKGDLIILNSLNKIGHINFWVKSKIYNHVENAHQFLLLSLADVLKKNG